MDYTYNSNLYLTTNDLNSIENRIEYLTNEIQENVFENIESPLRNIQVGDNLNNKTLYISFPTNIYEDMTSDEMNLIITDNNLKIRYFKTSYTNYDVYNIGFSYKNTSYTFYRKYSNVGSVRINRIRYKLPFDFGIVTDIDTNNEIYQYIKIYDNEQIIPNYEKHTWVDNEVLSMQKIDNIEHGIENIGYYYYKPNGWINGEEWLKTCNIKDYDNNTNTKNISYQDFNRWITDLSSINFDNLDKRTIWNSNITQFVWNEDSGIEWEEY